MQRASARFNAALLQSHEVATRGEVWSGGVLLATFPIASGTLTVDRGNLLRRTLTLSTSEGSAVAPSGANVPVVPQGTQGAFAPYGNELIVSRGIAYQDGTGDVELVQLGVFGIETTVITDTTDDLTVSITANDRARAVQRAGFTDVYVIAGGTNVGTAVWGILQQAYQGSPPFDQSGFAPTTAVTPSAPIVGKPGDDAMKMATDLAAGIGFGLYFDVTGRPLFLPIPDPSSAVVAWSFDEATPRAAEATARTLSRTNAPNWVIRDGQGTGIAAPVRGVSKDSSITSPTYFGGSYGVQVDYASSSLPTTQAQAQAAADAALLLDLGSVETATFTAAPQPDRDVDDVVTASRARSGIAPGTRYVVDAVSFGLTAADTMVLNTRAVTL